MPHDRPVSVTVERTVRPLRFAFLIEPSSQRQLRTAVELNTVLWGGQFNPIIPLYRRTPPWWADRPLRPPKARDIVEGYLRAFDPDIVVNLTSTVISLPGYGSDMFAERRLLTASELIQGDGSRTSIQYGLDVEELYHHLYSKEFRFTRRDAARVIRPDVNDRGMKVFAAVCFGSFPLRVGDYAHRYSQAFAPTVEIVDAPTLLGLLQDRTIHWPLRLGSAFLDAAGYAGDELTLFFMDGANVLDLLDYWNLRAAGWAILPVPRQWATGMNAPCVSVIKNIHRPHENSVATGTVLAEGWTSVPMMHQATIAKARSVTEANFEAFVRALNLPKGGMIVLRQWYPRIWDDWARSWDSASPVGVYAESRSLELQLTTNRLDFKNLAPPFVEGYGGHGNPRWANIVSVRRFDADVEHAAVVPPGLPGAGRAVGAIKPWQVRATQSGLAVLCDQPGGVHSWELPSSLKVFETWAKNEDLSISLSSAGNVTRQLLHQVGGVRGVRLLADADLLKMLNDMSRGKSVPVGEIVNRLHSVSRERLVEIKALRVGVECQCPDCQQTSWFSLGEIRERLRCEKCLSEFDFPAAAPPRDPWRYKTAGAFSIPDYCLGGYSVALALRFLTQLLPAASTSIPSFNLEGTRLKLEADFGVFFRSGNWQDRDPYLLFGECKTFGRFGNTDVKRARQLAQRFPGSVLVFCTLNKELTRAERRLLQPMALAGRKYLRGEEWQNPVLVLTRTELLATLPPPHSWEAAGGKFADFAKQYRHHPGTLAELCDATQQLHLGLESHWTTRKRDFNRRQERARQRREARQRPQASASS